MYILLLFMMWSLLIIVNVYYCYIVHWTRISMYIEYWILNKYYGLFFLQICKKLYRSSVWGPTCDALDCLHSDCKLPELLTGDWLMYANMGAYTLSAGTTFNGMPSPLRHYVLHREWLWVHIDIKMRERAIIR